MSDKPNLSIVLPTYNEKENVALLIPRIEETFRDIEHEIIIVDDNSPDGITGLISDINETFGNIRLITRFEKAGIGSALRDGYNSAKNEIIISSDADLSFFPDDMLKLYEKTLEGFDMVLGSRHIETGIYETGSADIEIKYLISKFGNSVVRFLTGLNIHDFSANFRSIRNDVWRRISTTENTNILLLEMILRTISVGGKVTEIPVTFKNRVYGKTKLKLSIELPKYLIRMIKYIYQYRFKK